MTELLSGYVFDPKNKIWVRKSGSEPFSYSDGDLTETRLYNALKNCRDVSLFSSDIQRHCIDWPSRYHFPPDRANIVRPFADRIKNGKTLELGSGCGGVTRFLGELGGDVIAVDGSAIRSKINSERCRDLTNVTVIVDTIQEFKTTECFDVVTLIGVLEYSQVYVESENPIDRILKIASGFLKEDGVLLIAIENQLGLKYFCGAPEDHVGRSMYGINDSYTDKSVITFGRKELTDRIKQSGFKNIDVYIPFPDYKLPLTMIYPRGLNTDDPDWNLGTLISNTVVHEPQPFKNPLFSLEQDWQVVVRNGLTADLANSLLLVAHKNNDDVLNTNILAAHYSSPAGRWTSIREHQFVQGSEIKVRTRSIMPTSVFIKDDWTYTVYEPGVKSYDLLVRIVNRPSWRLQELIDWVCPWIECLRGAAITVDLKPKRFKEYETFLPGKYFDAMPTNLIIRNDGKPVLIDLEWEYETPIPIEFVLHRGLYLSLFRLVSCDAPEIGTSLRIFDICETVLKNYGINFSEKSYGEYIDFFNDFQNEIAGFQKNSKNRLVAALSTAYLSVREGLSYSSHANKSEKQKIQVTKKSVDKNLYSIWQRKHKDRCLGYKSIFNSLSKQFDSSPIFKFIMTVMPGEEAYLADVVDALAAQTSENWRLSVVSPMPAPDMLFNELESLEWVTVSNDYEYFQAVDNLLSLSNYDWVGFVEPGLSFESDYLMVLTVYVLNNIEWKYIYSDEDSFDFYKNRVSPKFKPNINIDLLRSTPYLGGLCFIDRETLACIGGYSRLIDADFYDFALKVWEKFGDTVFGHIPDILVHTIKLPNRNINYESYRTSLQDHLGRLGLDGTVKNGQIEGTFNVEFNWPNQPLVSILVPTRNRLDLLKPCIESIVTKTSYPNYEIIIIDNQSDEQETLDYFEYLERERANYIRVISYPKVYNYSAINNFAAEHALGDYLLLLNNDTVIVQDNWIDRLLNHGQRKEVGIVGARLVFPNQTIQHAGVILGMGSFGVADHPHISLPMTDPGYMNRAQVVQNFSAVTAACLLIPKSLYFEVGGLDEENFKVLFNDVDLCLKVRERGYKIVWTPYATVVHHGSSSIKGDKNPDKAKRARQEADKMLEKWLPQLANDPAYNRNLSLKHRHFQIETETDVTWNIDFHDRLRIYAFPANDSGVGEYRVRAPLRALTNAAMIQSSLLPNHSATLIPDIVEIERVKPDVLLLQNGTADYLIHAWEQYKRFNSVFRIYSQDDLVFALPGKHPLQGKWPKDMRKRLRKLMENSDRLIVANEPLKEAYSRWIGDIKVVPNYLESNRWVDLPVTKKERTSNKLRVGWAGGAQHHGDLEFIFPVVESLKDEVDWIFMGMCPDRLKPIIKEYHGGVPFDLYPQKLAELDLDLAIAPLEYNNFNMAKTNLRILEYGVLGWPVICSDILPYQNAPVTLVGNNTQYWFKEIREKIAEPEALRAEGRVLQQWVLDNYLLEDHLDDWLNALTP